MRAWEIRDSFGLENLTLVERPDPSPGPGQVLVRTRACSLNYRDLLMARGRYNPKQPLPLIPLSDGAGEVVAVGEGVSGVAVGDRVAATFTQRWIGGEPDHTRLRATLGGPLDGCLAELLPLAAEGVVPVPDYLTWEEAATLPCAGVTAWNALAKYRRAGPGDTVLLQGTGGVSIFALQIAKLLGATAIVTSSSDEKLERAGDLGADHLINYREQPDWEKAVRALTHKRGVDHVVEVGGPGTLDRALRCTRVGGFIALIGVLAGTAAPVNLLPAIMSTLTLQGITVGSRDDFVAMNRALAAQGLRPVVDRVFPFDQAPEAFRVLQGADHFGKVAITVG